MSERAGFTCFARAIIAIAPFALSGCTSSNSGGPGRSLESGGSPNAGGSNAGGVAGTGGQLQSSGGVGAQAGSAGTASTGGDMSGSGGAPTSSGGAGGTISSGGGGGSAGAQGPDGGIVVPPPPELTWTLEDPKTPLVAIWGTASGELYVIDDKFAWHRAAGGTWQIETIGAAGRLTGIWGSGPTDVYISAFANVMLHSTGNAVWDHQGVSSGYTFRDVWGSGPANVYAVGSGMMLSTGAGTWTPDANFTFNANGVWGSSASDVYVASVGSDVYHRRSDGQWLSQQTPADNLDGIWGASATDIYAIGTGKILHSTGDGVWTEQALPPGPLVSLPCIWGLSSSAVYVGTLDSRVFRSGGDGRWFSQTIDASRQALDIQGIWGTSPENLYIVTGAGLYHGVKP